jgi:hypothetical protein
MLKQLVVDKWGRMEVIDTANDTAKFVVKDNNLSLVEYELVNVQEY